MPVTVHNVMTVLRQSFTGLGVENKLETGPVVAGSEDNANQEGSTYSSTFITLLSVPRMSALFFIDCQSARELRITSISRDAAI